jgi:hypothetical protein
MTEQPETGSTLGADGGVDGSGGADDNEAYHGYSVDDETQPQSTGDSLVDDEREVDPMEEGWNPPEKWSVAQGYGNTPLEEELGETLDQRVAQEVPEPDPYLVAEAEDLDADELEIGESEVGDARSGRLVDTHGGVGPDDEPTLVADDVGIDGAAASAEEAAVHVIDEDVV